MPVFSVDDRKTITRRQLRIAIENAGYAASSTLFTQQIPLLLAADSGNATFYNEYRNQIKNYEKELELINGLISADYTDGQIEPFISGDMSNGAKLLPNTLFFPDDPIPYTGLAPKYTVKLNGALNPTGTASRYEQNILTNTDIYTGLTNMIFRLENGISGSGGGGVTGSVPAGVSVGVSLGGTSDLGLSAGQLIYVAGGGGSAIYIVDSYSFTALPSPTSSLVMSSIVPASSPFSASSVTASAAAFTPTQRENLSGGTYNMILNSIADQIDVLVSEWEANLDLQRAELVSNTDARNSQSTENIAAIADIDLAKLAIDTWQALPRTGATGRFTVSSIPPLSSAISIRSGGLSNRDSEIMIALGQVIVSGNSYSGTGLYTTRYQWLDLRINKAYGSARRYFASFDSKAQIEYFAAANILLKNEYDLYFNTKKVNQVDETTIVTLSDVTGYSSGDQIVFLSETQPETERAIMEVIGSKMIRLDRPLPATYTVEDDSLLRCFKVIG